MTKKLIVANWKMNGSQDKIEQDLSFYKNNQITNQQNVVLALPDPYLAAATQIPANFCLASQDISQFVGYGAFTGEVSATMFKELGVKYAIIGHSERRTLLGESGSILVKKLDNAINADIVPIFCIGEDQSIRDGGKYLEFLVEQLDLLNQLNSKIDKLVIAYEPIWSIGTGKIPTLEQIAEIASLVDAFVQKYLPHVKIATLYGGSVSAKNIADILQLSQIAGVLVGGASLKTDEFAKICAHA
jgi:triosephosphate isomerase (TIM)